MRLLTAANSKHVSICICYVKRDVWISAILSLLILAVNLTLKYIIHVRIRLNFIFIPTSSAPRPLETPWTRSKRWQEAAAMLQRSGLSDIRKLKKGLSSMYGVFFFFLTNNFVCCFQQWYVQQYTPASIMSNLHWSLMANLARQHFHWYPMCPLNLTKKALRAW